MSMHLKPKLRTCPFSSTAERHACASLSSPPWAMHRRPRPKDMQHRTPLPRTALTSTTAAGGALPDGGTGAHGELQGIASVSVELHFVDEDGG